MTGFLFEPQPWRRDAACTVPSLNLFFVPQHATDGQRRVALAKAICATCPVRQECLDYALITRERFGVWGGHTVKERNKLIRELGVGQQPGVPAECGNDAGYNAHRRAGEPTCQPCRDAHARRVESHRAASRESAA